MFTFITKFRIYFSKVVTFEWFVMIVLGLMIRSGKLGVTSIICDLNLKHSSYEKIIYFFRSIAWKLYLLSTQWFTPCQTVYHLYREGNSVILVGDERSS